MFFKMTQSTPAGRHGGRLLENLFQSKHLKWKKIGSLGSKTSPQPRRTLKTHNMAVLIQPSIT